MKRILCRALFLLLALALCAGCLTACFSSEEEGTRHELTDDGEKKDPQKDNASGKTPEQKPEAKEKATVAEQVCFSWGGLTVTAKSLKLGGFFGAELEFLTENTGNKNYTVSSHAVIINDYMMDTSFLCSVAAGKKATEEISVFSSDLEEAGITEIEKFEISFYVYDSDTYKTVYEELCTVKTSLYGKVTAAENDKGKALYNEGGIRIVGKYVEEDALFGSSVLLYIENNSAKNITLSGDDISVNGYMISGLLAESVYAGKKAMTDIFFLSDDLKNNGIQKISTIELKFKIYNDDFTSRPITSGVITIRVD